MRGLYSTKFYSTLPIFLQNAFVTFKGLSYSIIRGGINFKKFQKSLEKIEKLNENEIHEYQFIRLKSLINHAYKYVPYYNKLFNKINFKPDDLKDISDLNKLPYLDKKTICDNINDFVALNYRHKRLFKGSTSGSTGSPLSLYMDRNLIQSEHAFIKRQYRWAGCIRKAKVLMLRGDLIVPINQTTPPFWRYDAYTREVWFSSYHLSEKTASSYLEYMQKLNPDLIVAYPSSLFVLAQYANHNNLKIKLPALKGIITSSETLFENQKDLFQRVFNVPVFDWYGSFERVIFIGTCEFGSYHIFPDYGITEFIPVKKRNNKILYELVGTGFINSAMPLIRYRTGDIVTKLAGECRCGRKFPRINTILGRFDDMIITPEGRFVGRIDHIFKGVKNVRSAQLIQENKHELTIFIVPETSYSIKEERKILNNATMRLGKSINIAFKYVNEIPRLSNGKFKAVISKVTY